MATAVEKWKQLDFQELQNQLDASAADIASRQEESQVSRNRLIDLSKDFRQLATDEVRKQVQPLLRSFQTEVDSLLKRSKSAEAAFLHVYKALTVLPDPHALVDYIAQLEEKSVENKQLRETLDDCNRQLAANKTQEAKRSRELLLDLESKNQTALEERIKLTNEQLAGELAEKEAEWLQDKALMERRLSDAEEQVGILRRELDRCHSELSRSRMMNGQSEDEKIALFAEDLDRANERATAAEFKIAELQQQLASLQKQVNKAQESSSLSADVSSRGQLNQQDAVQRLRDELDRLKNSYQAQFDRMDDQLSRLGSQNSLLLHKLETQRDYEQVKQELSLLKSAHYSEDISNGSLESVLLARNRRLENENAGLRVRESEMAGCLRPRTNGNHGGNSFGLNVIHHMNSSSDGELDNAPSPEEDEAYSDDYLGELETNLTPEMSAKISEAKGILQSLGGRSSATLTGRFMNTLEVADQVNRVLEEEGITRCALAKFVLHGSYKMVYDALHDPRPWGFLNSAGRDKYRKLKLWAEDARCINAVKILQVYCKDKRRRSDTAPTCFISQDNHPFGGMLESGTCEEPTDLSLPKSAVLTRRKSFIPVATPQSESTDDLAGSGPYWSIPKAASSLSSLRHSSSFIPQSRPLPLHNLKSESHSPESQTLPPAPKRTSPQHSVPRRHSKDLCSSSSASLATMSQPAGIFRPSASFTASPVALGISFPDYRKNVLHQITDDMINQFDPLDTDQVTRAVRSKLNKCNVSQRLFGEVVLGMSQGAVSDLLKRPKPWNKLTRPTKEHYVRMQQFIEDEQSIPVLQAIQNREDPERVLNALNEEDDDKTEVAANKEAWRKEDSPQSLGSAGNVISAPVATPALAVAASSTGPPEMGLSDSELSEREAFQAVKEHFAKFYQITDVSRNSMLDTVAVASKIKEELRARNLQQKLIGELVLDVGQGTVSELLNKPKPYGMLSMKGRENYMKLLKLIQTVDDFTLLEALRTQGQQKANANKRTRGSSDSGEAGNGEKRLKCEPEDADNSTGGDDENQLYLDEDELQDDSERSHFRSQNKYGEEESESTHGSCDEDGEIINGVCVPKSAIRSRGASYHDTVIVQPSPGLRSYLPSHSHSYSPKISSSERDWSHNLPTSNGSARRMDNFAKLQRGLREDSDDGDRKDW